MTGVSSYLASEILPLLEKDDNIEKVLGLDIIKPNYSHPKLEFKNRDVRDKKLEEDLKGYDVLIHLAFIVSPLRSVKEMYSINIDGSKNVFNCAINAGVKKIIHASSVAAYGSFKDNPVPITEDFPIRLMKKRYYYHETKYLVEKYLVDEIEIKHPDIIITRFRPHIFLGPTINNEFKDFFNKKRLYSFFPDDKMQFIWANDVAQAFYLATIKKAPGSFNIGGDNPLSTREIAKKLNKKVMKLSYKFTIGLLLITYKLHVSKKLDPGWVRMSRYPIIVDSTKAKKVLGWKPKYDTFGSIQAFLNYFRENN